MIYGNLMVLKHSIQLFCLICETNSASFKYLFFQIMNKLVINYPLEEIFIWLNDD